MTFMQRIIIVAAALGVCACEIREPAITPPESTYTRVRVPVVVNGTSEMSDVATVNPEFFKTGDLRPLLGRFFIDGEFQAGGTPVAVLSHAYWTDRFKAAPAVIGSEVIVDGTRRTIVGVATAQLQPAKPASVWIPRTGPMRGTQSRVSHER